MSSTLDTEITSTDDELRSHLLTDAGLSECEEVHPGKVHLLAVGRYTARLQAESSVVTFSLRETPRNGKSLFAEFFGNEPEQGSLLWELLWHKSAEAMLAVRRGHTEARLRNKARKQARA